MSRVLVVDDNSATRNALARLLQHEGYETLTAQSGVEALETLKHGRADLVLLDINMPEMDGLQILERLQSDPVLSMMPVVMMTAVSDNHTISRARQLGAKSFLIKATFSVDEMLSTVKRFAVSLMN